MSIYIRGHTGQRRDVATYYPIEYSGAHNNRHFTRLHTYNVALVKCMQGSYKWLHDALLFPPAHRVGRTIRGTSAAPRGRRMMWHRCAKYVYALRKTRCFSSSLRIRNIHLEATTTASYPRQRSHQQTFSPLHSAWAHLQEISEQDFFSFKVTQISQLEQQVK